ncbi:MAG: hypothetical protein COC01_10410 [Bacteroidetes bacterium]|nr:MAG: hypothetical protein COC01_10410 [Bacteroidota bacterium]
MTIISKSTEITRICPYPGPRSFNENESILFKGRDQYLGEISNKLAKHHFLLVTGASGDGKSSFIFAGLFPYVRAGFLKSKHYNWAIADFRPRRDPLRNLAISLAYTLDYNDIQLVENKLQNGYSALVDLYKNSSLYGDKNSQGANLIILADQFEEFFTNEENYNVETGTASQKAQNVVQILLETVSIAQKENLPLYVVCTMRSDYFGHCTAFSDFPKLIVNSQFYLERLNRREMLEAIREPAILTGNNISERLLQALMNELTDDIGIDMLPILQHCLYQIWKSAGEGEQEMDLIHYAKVGGYSKEQLSKEDQQKYEEWFAKLPAGEQASYGNPCLRNVLDIHANRLYDTAHEYYNANNPNKKPITKEEAQEIIKIVFKCLTKIDDNRSVRNLMSLEEITNMIGDQNIDFTKASMVLDIFRIDGNTFLRPFVTQDPITHNLKPKTVLDITHEALMRNWTRLEEWAWEEYEGVITYRELCAQLNKWLNSNRAKTNLLSAGNLIYFERWYKKRNIKLIPWLTRYIDEDTITYDEVKQHYDNIGHYISDSRSNIDRKQKVRTAVTVAITGLLIITSIALYFAIQLQQEIKLMAKSNEIASKATMALGHDPTKSFRLAEAAFNVYPSKLSRQLLMASYSKMPFYTFLRGHKKSVNRAKFTPDGKYVVSISYDETMRVWDLKGEELTSHTVRINSNSEHDVYNISHDSKLLVAAYRDYTFGLSEILGDVITTFKGHNGYVNSIYFSSDDKYLLTAAEDTTLKIWDITGREIQTFKGHKNRIRCAKFFHSGDKIFSVSYDNTVRIWDKNGKELKKLDNLNFGWAVDANISPNDKFIVTTSADYPRLWNIVTNEVLYLKGHEGNIVSSFFSDDGQTIVTGSEDKTARIWNLKGETIAVLEGHSSFIKKAVFSPDGKLIATASYDGTARLWDVRGHAVQTMQGHLTFINDLNFSPDGKSVVTSSWGHAVKIWGIAPQEKTVITGHYSIISSARFSPDGNNLITTGNDSVARIWDISGYQVGVLRGHESNYVSSAKYSTDGQYILTTGGDNVPRLWNTSGNELQRFSGHNGRVRSATISPNSKYVITVTGEDEAILRFWDLEGKQIMSMENTVSARFSNDGNFLITRSNPNIDTILKVYEIMGDILPESLNLIKSFDNFPARIRSFSFSPDDKHLILLIENFTNQLYSFHKNKSEFTLIKSFKGHEAPIENYDFSEDGKFFVTASVDKNVIIWDMDGNQVRVLKGHSDIVNDVDFSADGKYVATASQDLTVRIWDINGNELQILTGHTADIYKVKFSPDNKYVLSLSADQTAQLMPLFAEDVLRKINIEKVRGEVWQLSEKDKEVFGIVDFVEKK